MKSTCISTMLALAILAGVYAQTSTTSAAQSVVSLFLPNSDPQPLVGSIISEGPSQTVLVIQCNADASACGYVIPVTITAGPSTFSATAVYDSVTVNIDCAITGTTETGTCTQTYFGPAGYFNGSDSSATDTAAANTALTSEVQTATVAASDITLFPITITAGGSGAPGQGSATTSTGTASSTTRSGSGNISGTSGTAASTAETTAPNSNDARGSHDAAAGGYLAGIVFALVSAITRFQL